MREIHTYKSQCKRLLILVCFFYSIYPKKSFAQVCNDSSFNILLSLNNQQYTIGDGGLLTCMNGDNITAGFMNAANNLNNNTAIIFRGNQQGVIQWAKQLYYSATVNTLIDQVHEIRDGSFIVTGRYNDISISGIETFFIAKLNNTGSLMWQHAYKFRYFPLAVPLLTPRKIAEDTNGDIYFLFDMYSPGYQIVTKLNAGGTIIWSKGLLTSSALGSHGPVYNEVFIKGDTLSLIGTGSESFNSLQLNKLTSDTIESRQFNIVQQWSPSDPFSIDYQSPVRTMQLSNGHYIICAYILINTSVTAYSLGAQYMIAELDENLQMVHSGIIKTLPHSNEARDVIINPDGSLIVAFYDNYNTHRFYYGKINQQWSAPVQKRLDINYYDYPGNSFLNIDSNNRIRFSPVRIDLVNNIYGSDIYYLNAGNNYNGLCFQETDTSFLSLEDFQTNTIYPTYERIDDNALIEIPPSITVSDIPFSSQELCRRISICDTLKLKGESSICMYNSPAVFIAEKGVGCLRKINWETGTAPVDSVKIVNDTTLNVYFNGSWDGYIYASLTDCTLKDSLLLHVYKYNSVAMFGADTSFCEGDSIELTANSSYSSYMWSTNAISQSIFVNQPGNYSVLAQRPDGCFDVDSIKIISLYSLPEINLPTSNVLCIGQNDILNAGNGFANYYWQDGNTHQDYLVTLPGLYWVKVTDSNGCVKSDSVIVTALSDPPNNFIYSDTSICKFETIVLKPYQVFPSYLWNNGSTSSFLEIQQAGIYWLKILDSNGCTATAQINVHDKFCANSIYFPSAFTPNYDGKNDLFKPTIRGNLISYQLDIFNRWGQRVFSTSNPLHGWSGYYQSEMQSGGVFVWQAVYQFSGEKTILQKGTVTLVR